MRWLMAILARADNKKGGFMLIALMIVVIIVGILAVRILYKPSLPHQSTPTGSRKKAYTVEARVSWEPLRLQKTSIIERRATIPGIGVSWE